MRFNEYQEGAFETFNQDLKGKDKLLNVTLGLVGESGEFADLIKKAFYQGHDIDLLKIEEELGDILWYVAVAAEVCGLSLEEVAIRNIEKLKARYPEGFSEEASREREEATASV